jgi:hypothetical protein
MKSDEKLDWKDEEKLKLADEFAASFAQLDRDQCAELARRVGKRTEEIWHMHRMALDWLRFRSTARQ